MARKRSASGDYLEANQGFATTFEGEPLFVQKGELVHKDHPLVKGREELFDPAKRISRFDVEQATAAPGEKRGRRSRVSETTEAPAEAPAEEPAEEPAAEPESDDEQSDDDAADDDDEKA